MGDSSLTRRLALSLMLAASAAPAAMSAEPFTPTPRPSADFPNIGYATWSDDEPAYRFYPGDAIEVTVLSAPELNKTATVQPDGRIALPLIPPIMAADRTTEELRAAITQAYASQLLRPEVSIGVKTIMPLRIFVGGEVDKPGIYDMPGDIDSLQAIIQAGGFKVGAKRTQVVIIRRGANGRAMMRTVDLMNVFRNAGETDLVPLRRFDIVYVPRTRVAEAALFVQQYFRDLSPVQFGFSYAINGQTN